MSTLDRNDLVVLQGTDQVAPLHPLINGVTESISQRFDKLNIPQVEAGVRPASPKVGQLIWDKGDLGLYLWNGTRWKPMNIPRKTGAQLDAIVAGQAEFGDTYFDTTKLEPRYWNGGTMALTGGPRPTAKDSPDTSAVLTGDYSLIANWRALTTGWYYNSNGSMAGMPTSYGMVYVRRRGSEGHVTYYSQSTGPQFRMVWNGSTTTVVWEREYFNRELDITGTQNLNDYTSSGIYSFNQDTTATNGSNFPINAAGVLEVMGAGSMKYQRYTAYKSYSGHVYYRNQYAGTWGSWEQIGKGVCSGGMTIALPTQGTVANASVSFPTNRFTTAPSVSVSHWTTAPQNCATSFSTLTPTGMVVHAVRTVGTGDLNVRWIAVGFGA